MKKIISLLVLLLSVQLLLSCSEKKEDKIITDLNEVLAPYQKGRLSSIEIEIVGSRGNKRHSVPPSHITEEDMSKLLAEKGIYYDYSIGKYRQKYEFIKEQEKASQKPTNPITLFLVIMAILFLMFMAWLLYATYKQAIELHRVLWIWIINSLLGGISSFIILSLSRALKYDEAMEYREETDLLGITILAGNIAIILLLAIMIKLYMMILNNPDILKDFLDL